MTRAAVARKGVGREKSETAKMNRLRIYTNMGNTGTPLGQEVFYSHRAGGPYYLWCREQKPGQWRFSRVHPPASTLKALRVTTLKDTPTALRTKLGEHYAWM